MRDKPGKILTLTKTGSTFNIAEHCGFNIVAFVTDSAAASLKLGSLLFSNADHLKNLLKLLLGNLEKSDCQETCRDN